ncbi:hypothetical protein BTS2_3365 [Bacillus sp. TS-2]|nr:hypothetical protein BTS2_3365 [Bacillus sp. TS-2]
MKKKIIAGVVVISLIVGGTSVYAYNQHLSALEEQRLEEVRLGNLNAAYDSVESFYKDERTALSDNIDDESFKLSIELINKVEDEETKALLLSEIDNIKLLFNYQTIIHSYLDEDSVLKSYVTHEDLEKTNNELQDIKAINESIFNSLNELLNVAIEQMDVLIASDKQLLLLEDSLKRADLEDTEKLIASIKNESIKKEYTGKFKEIEKSLIAKEEAEKEEELRLKAAAEEAQRQAEELAKKESVQNNNTNSTSSVLTTTNSSNSTKESSKTTNTSNTTNVSNNKNTDSGKTNVNTSGNSSSNKNSDKSSSGSTSPDNTKPTSSNSKQEGASNNGGNIKNVQKTDEGTIKNHGGSQEGANTYERGTFEWDG